MVRVEAPPATVTPPPSRDRVAPWLGVMSLFLLADSVLPWERVCTNAFDGFRARCFSASVWSGSASLLGVLAFALLVAYVIATLRKGIVAPVGIGRLSVFAGALAAIAAKTVIVAGNDEITSKNQSEGGPAWIGVWFGMFLALAGLSLLATTAWRARPRLRSILVVVAVVFAVVSAAIPYARSGLAWWGGPIADPAYLGGGNGSGYLVEPGEPLAFTHNLYFRNLGTVPVTFDGLDLLEETPGIRVLGTYAVTPGQCTPTAVQLKILHPPDGCTYPLAGFRFEPGGVEHNVLLAMVVVVDEPGLYRSGWFRVRYHAGVLPFEVFRTDTVEVCVPEPGRKRCPGY
jgi:hypothetical protein